MEYDPDYHSAEEWLNGPEATIAAVIKAQEALAAAQAFAPVGQPPDDQHPGAYRDSLHVGEPGHANGRVDVPVIADVPYAEEVENDYGYHPLGRAASAVNDGEGRGGGRFAPGDAARRGRATPGHRRRLPSPGLTRRRVPHAHRGNGRPRLGFLGRVLVPGTNPFRGGLGKRLTPGQKPTVGRLLTPGGNSPFQSRLGFFLGVNGGGGLGGGAGGGGAGGGTASGGTGLFGNTALAASASGQQQPPPGQQPPPQQGNSRMPPPAVGELPVAAMQRARNGNPIRRRTV